MTTVSRTRVASMTILRHRLRREIVDTPVIFAIVFVLAIAITLVVSMFTPVRISAWDLATQFVRWYGGGLGVYVTAVYLPIYITHGYTRRAFLRQLPIFVGAAAALAAALVALGYAAERLIYRVAGWDQQLTNDHLFSSPTDLGSVALSFGLVILVYLVGGALAGAAFYRNVLLGFGLIPLLAAVAATNEMVHRGIPVPAFLPTWVVEPIGASPFASAFVQSVGVVAVMGVLLWWLVRDLPIRSKPA
jgi:hypothetical protein